MALLPEAAAVCDTKEERLSLLRARRAAFSQVYAICDITLSKPVYQLCSRDLRWNGAVLMQFPGLPQFRCLAATTGGKSYVYDEETDLALIKELSPAELPSWHRLCADKRVKKQVTMYKNIGLRIDDLVENPHTIGIKLPTEIIGPKIDGVEPVVKGTIILPDVLKNVENVKLSEIEDKIAQRAEAFINGMLRSGIIEVAE
jgi:hypothetical protein